MLVFKNQKLNLTLFTCIVLALSLVEASSHSSGAVSRRDHSNLKRMVKKRSPLPAINKQAKEDQNLAADVPDLERPVGGAGADPASSSSSSVVSSSSSSSSSSLSSSTSASSVSTSSGSLSSSSSASSSAASSSSESSSSLSSSSSTTAVATEPTGPVTPSKATVTQFSTASLPQETASANNVSGGASQSKSTILITLIAVAASVGGVVLLWTIFRKWKLGRSKQFDQRLQPIDWQPTGHDDGDGIVPPHRRLSGASFRSAGTGARNYGSASDAGHGSSEYGSSPLQPIPDHDFTAGPSLAPVGGYADLSRGPSPQPQMTERAPAMTRSGYDANVPLHHQGYGSQDAYGGVRY